MINKIIHLSDIHIRKVPTRNEEYEQVFNNLFKSLKKEKPDRIVIVGDLVHDYLDLQGEQLIMANDLLDELSKIAPVRITRGNHDFRKKNKKRVDSVKAIVKTLKNSDVIYYDNADVYYDENIAWFVWHHGQTKNNPWKTKEGKAYEKLRINGDYVAIDLFHDPINGCKSPSGFEMKSKSYYKISDFKGDISMFGDIHKMQYLDKKETKAYCGSLIAQDFNEGDDNFHGYIIWDISDGSHKDVQISNDWSFKNIRITPYVDFDDLDFEIENPTKYMRIRFLWTTLPQTRTKENERKLISYIKSTYKDSNIISVANKNLFVETEKIDVNENITLENVTNKAVQHEIFKEYLEKIGTDENIINDIITLDEEIIKLIEVEETVGVEWDVVKFGGTNFMSYEEINVEWKELEGLFQITGINTAGKTTIMKLIAYSLFGKTLETETRMKYGDQRFVNNRNNAKFCETYLVIEANGEYFGIKRKTEITRAKDGSINGSPTILSYYLLSSPDDEMNDDTSIEKLDEDKRIKTQKNLIEIVGTYDNFMRIVMTTSDTLNRILSNDMAVFIDSLLFDSGLDIFDKKLEGIKSHQKNVNDKGRVSCNLEIVSQQNTTLTEEITILQDEVTKIETVRLPDVQERTKKGREYVETLTKKLFKIDPEISNLDTEEAKKTIIRHEKEIDALKERKSALGGSIDSLKESYDEEKLNQLIEKKEEHKTAEYDKKLEIKTLEQDIRDEEHKIEVINGDIFRLKETGLKLKEEIKTTKNSKVCDKCGQEIKKQEHIDHIAKVVSEKEDEMFKIAEQIKTKENVDKKTHESIIETKKVEIGDIKKTIEEAALIMEDVLFEIGNLTNDKNDVEKRKELQNELIQIPTKIRVEELEIKGLQQKIDSHENSLKQIEENVKIEHGITLAKSRITLLEGEETEERENILIKKSSIGEKQNKIKDNTNLIAEFEAQEYRDMVMNLYKKCVHRDGIPRQMLVNYIIPKINETLENILSSTQFNVWLDPDDLRPKLVYYSRPNAIIDCIGASGKERTFASVVLKFALNQINVKSKPKFFLLDEVMGKLDLEGSVEEFIQILQLIKDNMKRLLVVEQVHEINPDYIIDVQLNEDGISSLSIE